MLKTTFHITELVATNWDFDAYLISLCFPRTLSTPSFKQPGVKSSMWQLLPKKSSKLLIIWPLVSIEWILPPPLFISQIVFLHLRFSVCALPSIRFMKTAYDGKFQCGLNWLIHSLVFRWLRKLYKQQRISSGRGENVYSTGYMRDSLFNHFLFFFCVTSILVFVHVRVNLLLFFEWHVIPWEIGNKGGRDEMKLLHCESSNLTSLHRSSLNIWMSVPRDCKLRLLYSSFLTVSAADENNRMLHFSFLLSYPTLCSRVHNE